MTRKFGRRKSSRIVSSQNLARMAASDRSSVSGPPILVRQSAFDRSNEEAWILPSAVIDTVNALQGFALYTRAEFSPRAIQAYHADYYLAQVNNGGHSQFVHNSGRNAPFVWTDAEAGLAAMGAHVQRELLTTMIDWTLANPDAAQQQNGFSQRDAFLDQLDKAFYAAENDAPLSAKATAWIKAWPELEVISDDAYADRITALADANPDRPARAKAGSLNAVSQQLSAHHLAIGYAARMIGTPEVVLGHDRGASFVSFDGEDVPALGFQTNQGRRVALLGNRRVAILPEGAMDAHHLAVVETADLERLSEATSQTQSAAMILALLQTRNVDPASATIQIGAWTPGSLLRKRQLWWIVMTEHEVFRASVTPTGGALHSADGASLIAEVSAWEVDRTAETASAAYPELTPPSLANRPRFS